MALAMQRYKYPVVVDAERDDIKEITFSREDAASIMRIEFKDGKIEEYSYRWLSTVKTGDE